MSTNEQAPAPQAQPDARAVEVLKAANEALAMVTAFEDDARYIMGNTNFTILQQRREQVKQALQAISAPAAKCSKRRSAEDEYQVREWALIGLYLVEGRTTTDSESGISIEWAFGDKPALLADAEGWALEDAREDYDRIFCDLTNDLMTPGLPERDVMRLHGKEAAYRHAAEDIIAALSPASPARTPMGEPVAWIERQNDGTRYGEPKRWPPSDRARSYAQEMGRTLEPLYAAASPARTPMGAPQVLKGVGKINGDGWKDTTTKGEVVYVWNAEKPSPYAPGQYPRIDNEGWSASTAQYDFSPASVDEVRALAAPTPMGGEVEALREAVRLALEDADALERIAEEADDNQWPDWSATMRQAALRIKTLAAPAPSPAQGGRPSDEQVRRAIQARLHLHPTDETLGCLDRAVADIQALFAPPSVQPVEGK